MRNFHAAFDTRTKKYFFPSPYKADSYRRAFFSKHVKFTELVFFCFWRISRIVTERLRMLIHVSNYFQTFGNYGKNALR